MPTNDKQLTVTTKKNIAHTNIFDDLVSQYTVIEAEAINGLSETEMNKLKARSRQKLLELEPQDPVELMLIAQMLSVHKLQQEMMPYANESKLIIGPVCLNPVIKLSNLFVTQANLLHKLRHGTKTGDAHDGKDKENGK
jgi:DNA-directed RNA polymerase subunit F